VILAGFSSNINLIVGRSPALAASKKGLVIAMLDVSQWICRRRGGIGSVGLFADARKERADAGNEDVERKWQRGLAGGRSG
jgi:hypothetical protein